MGFNGKIGFTFFFMMFSPFFLNLNPSFLHLTLTSSLPPIHTHTHTHTHTSSQSGGNPLLIPF